jgi:hypothetical protein
LLLTTLALTLSFPAFAVASDLSNPSLIPGAIDPNITHKNIHSTISVKDYTKAIRHPTNYTNKLKKLQLSEYSYDEQTRTLYEEDHLIPRSIDGNPNDPGHKSPEAHNSEWVVRKSDRFEIEFHRMVCVQKITYCGSTAHDVDIQALGIQQLCAWKSLSSWTWVWSCRLK